MERKLLKRGNHKLSSKIGVWTLPRHTCRGAGLCAKFCYAKKMEMFKNVQESREWRYMQSLRKVVL
jgi:Pyruvate/2-oxoacid:ferredoxin oxidoreductase delta subunit